MLARDRTCITSDHRFRDGRLRSDRGCKIVLARDGITLKHRIGGWGIERGARSDRGRELVLAGDGTGITSNHRFAEGERKDKGYEMVLSQDRTGTV